MLMFSRVFLHQTGQTPPPDFLRLSFSADWLKNKTGPRVQIWKVVSLCSFAVAEFDEPMRRSEWNVLRPNWSLKLFFFSYVQLLDLRNVSFVFSLLFRTFTNNPHILVSKHLLKSWPKPGGSICSEPSCAAGGDLTVWPEQRRLTAG